MMNDHDEQGLNTMMSRRRRPQTLYTERAIHDYVDGPFCCVAW